MSCRSELNGHHECYRGEPPPGESRDLRGPDPSECREAATPVAVRSSLDPSEHRGRMRAGLAARLCPPTEREAINVDLRD